MLKNIWAAIVFYLILRICMEKDEVICKAALNTGGFLLLFKMHK